MDNKLEQEITLAIELSVRWEKSQEARATAEMEAQKAVERLKEIENKIATLTTKLVDYKALLNDATKEARRAVKLWQTVTLRSMR